jgi:CHAT domain-containing protein
VEKSAATPSMESADLPITLKHLQGVLPGDVTIFEFSLSGESFLIWAIRAEGVKLIRRKISRTDITARVESFRRAIQAKERRRTEELGNSISALMLNGFPDVFLASKTLVFIPDKILHALPFAALKEPGTGKFLIESHSIETAQSARIYTRCLESYRDRAIPSEPRVLLVGNPSFDSDVFPNLGKLKGAEREVAEIAALYGSASPKVLVGASATKDRLLAMAKNADIIHIAAHTVLDSRHGFLSKIVLAGASGTPEEGVWTVREVYRAHLRRARLAILSGCSTADGLATDSEGLASLARAFMAAGIPAVVANLWEVNDQTQVSIAVELHRQFLLGRDPSEALRQAQVRMLYSVAGELQDPKAWAGLQLIGCGCHASHRVEAERPRVEKNTELPAR